MTSALLALSRAIVIVCALIVLGSCGREVEQGPLGATTTRAGYGRIETVEHDGHKCFVYHALNAGGLWCEEPHE